MSASSFVETSPTHSLSKMAPIQKILSQTEFNSDSSNDLTFFDSKIISQQNSPSSISKIRNSTKSFGCPSLRFSDEQQEWLGSFCTEHNKQNLYICLTCNLRICQDCSITKAKVRIEDMQHKRHQLRRYESELEAYNRKISKLFVLIHENKDLLLKNKERIMANFERRSQKRKGYLDCFSRNVDKFYSQSSSHNEEIQDKISLFSQNKQSILKHVANYENYLLKLKQFSKIKLLTTSQTTFSQQLNSSLSEISSPIGEQKEYKKNNGIRPFTEPIEVELENFNSFNEENQSIVKEFTRLNVKWKLKIYPNGYVSPASSQKMKEVKYLSVFIQMIDSPYEKGRFYFQVILKNQEDSSMHIEREFKSQFCIGESWGYDRFTRVHNLYRKGFIGKKGKLQIKVSVNWVDYNEGIKKMNEGIKIRESLVNKNEERIKRLKERIQKMQEEKANQQNHLQKAYHKCKIIRLVSFQNQQLINEHKDKIIIHRKALNSF